MVATTEHNDEHTDTRPRYGTDDDELARILAERQRRAPRQRLWPGLLSGAIIALLIGAAFGLRPVRDAVATLTAGGAGSAEANGDVGGERWEPADAGEAAATTAAYARVRATTDAAVDARRAVLAPLLEERIAGSPLPERLEALEAWARVHEAWQAALVRESLPKARYAYAAAERPQGLDAVDELLLHGPDGR